MIEDWHARYSDNIRDFHGYSIAKLFDLLTDPDIISLAGGLPSPDVFLKNEMRVVSKRRLDEDSVPDFQNPSGITMSLEKRKALLDLSYEYDIPIIEDSPYRDLRYFGETIPSIFRLDQEQKGGH